MPNDSRKTNENDLDVAMSAAGFRRRSDKVKQDIMKKTTRKLRADTGKLGKSTSKYK